MNVEKKDTPFSPIQSLNPDLLWLIFELNTTQDSTSDSVFGLSSNSTSSSQSTIPAIVTTRNTSQVCTSWRNILLESSSLWGRLIDLDMLDQPTNHWRNEILRRAGSAYLWITGNILGTTEQSTHVRTFFFSIIGDRDCWNRIQRIIVYLDILDISDERWKALCNRAPNLEIFKVTNPWAMDLTTPMFYSPPSSSSRHGTLFGNDAPSLRTFDADQIYFGHNASWLSHLRHIRFQAWFPPSHIITLLPAMPHLESLRYSHIFQKLDGGPVDNSANSLPCIHLPNLTMLYLEVQLGDLLLIMEHLTPAPGCALSISVDDTLAEYTPAPAPQALSKYTRSYFAIHPPKNLYFEFSGKAFTFEDMGEGNTTFYIRIYSWTGISQDLGFLLLDSLRQPPSSPPYFNSLSTLILDLSHNPQTSPLFSNLMTVLEAMPSVTTLRTSSESLQVLLGLESPTNPDNPGRSVLFPMLRTIEIIFINLNGDRSTDYDGILPFLLRRQSAGLPISLLDFTKCQSYRLQHIDVLNGLNGLIIRWKRGKKDVEYVCGSQV
ncbi:hypothetical protein GALMADRAFT_244940 [Galerina marginata CBS 339.88]|uniref:F-box domain-containing protein n=1 Tax=Galerina marginata (strain CBS 339.88) TaxID=685588 RepID=A0A067T4A0_GALM3|nr:hypothetical protein GALMADRAFT_244940 [Galerina marginata CBS 339.88]